MELASHVVFQWVAFALCIAVVIVVLLRAASEPHAADEPTPTEHDGGLGRRSLMAALGAAVLAIAVPQLALAQRESSDRRAASREAGAGDLLPERLADWTWSGGATAWTPAPRAALPYALARYVRGDRKIEVFVAAADELRHKVTGYAIDLVGSGNWVEGKRRRLTDCTTPGCRDVHEIELDREHSNDVRHIYYVYTLGGRIVGSALELQFQRAWNSLAGMPGRARVIALASDGAELPAADVAAALDALAFDEARE